MPGLLLEQFEHVAVIAGVIAHRVQAEINTDLCLYSMGDHAAYHGYMLELIERHPGIVILNDLVLHRCILQTAMQQNELALVSGRVRACLWLS